MNGADVANQRRSHLITQRKGNKRTWRPLFYWLLDITLINCFILWRLQARRASSNLKLEWDPVEFNRALGNALLIFDPDLPALNLTKTNHKLKSIAPIRCKEAFPGIPKKVEAVTDLKSLLLARGHDMCTEALRREYIGCKIDGRVTRGGETAAGRQFGVDLTNAEYAKKVNTRYKQCNVYLCRKGKC
jgi:hypothetical protein